MTELSISWLILAFLLAFPLMAAAQKFPVPYSDKLLAEKAPPALPQTPRAPKLRSDLEDENLKGKVKSIVMEWRKSPNGKVTNHFEQYFDETGNTIMHAGGIPGTIPPGVTVWGYIDGHRVSLEGPESPVKFAGVTVPPKVRKKEPGRDDRYDERYEYKYDDVGRLIEKLTYENNGELRSRTLFSYNGDRQEHLIYVRNNKTAEKKVDLLGGRSVWILDKDGNPVKAFGYADDRVIIAGEFTYTYDRHGNWITRTTTAKIEWEPNKPEKRTDFEIRTITYYP